LAESVATEVWVERLGRLVPLLEGKLSSQQPTKGEHIWFEIWLCNPPKRTLFKLATLGKPGNKRFVTQVDGPHPLDGEASEPQQFALRDGQTIVMRHPRNAAKVTIATPLVLKDAPWHHLPVGVLTARTDHAAGRLATWSDRPDNLRTFADAISTWVAARLAPDESAVRDALPSLGETQGD
jgi:hypothetical protein